MAEGLEAEGVEVDWWPFKSIGAYKKVLVRTPIIEFEVRGMAAPGCPHNMTAHKIALWRAARIATVFVPDLLYKLRSDGDFISCLVRHRVRILCPK